MESVADGDGPASPVPTNSGPIQSILEDLEIKFGKAKTKHDVIHALESCTYLHKIPLPPPNVALEQAEKDFCRERVLLNDVAFVPDRYDLDRAHAFALTLRALLKRFMMHRAVFNDTLYRDHNTVCDLLMQRACRTSAGADSFFTVQKMLCIEGTFVTQKSLIDDPPIHIDAFLAPCADNDGDARHALCARVQVSNSFAIYDVSAMDLLGDLDDSSLNNLNEHSYTNHASSSTASSSSSSTIVRPWLDVESVVVDESNFLTGRHWRKLHLLITVPETGATYSSDEAHSPLKFREDSGLLHSQEHLHNSAHNSQRLSGRRVLRDLSSWLSLSPTHTPQPPPPQGTVSSVRQSTRSQQSHTSNTNTGVQSSRASSMSLSQQMQHRPMPPLVLNNNHNNGNGNGSRGIALLDNEEENEEERIRRSRLLLLSPSSQDNTPLSPLSGDVILEGDEDDEESTVLGIKGVRNVRDHVRAQRSATVAEIEGTSDASSAPSSSRHYSLG